MQFTKSKVSKFLLVTTALTIPNFAYAQNVGSNLLRLVAPDAPANSDTQSIAISADGNIVAGMANGNVAVKWKNGTPEALNASTASRGFKVNQISGDGLTITGRSTDGLDAAVYWTAAEGFVYFTDPSTGKKAFRTPYSDYDGKYFAVTSNFVGSNSNKFDAWRWSRLGGYESLGSFGPMWDMFTTAISGDGQKIAIDGVNLELDSLGNLFNEAAGFWTPTTGLVRLNDLSSAPVNGTISPLSRSFGISRDGSTIVGASRGADGFVQAVYWRGTNAFGLGFIPGASLPTDRNEFAIGATNALAANLDGSIIVGRSFGANNNLAWRWTAASGMQDLNIFAVNAGINLNGAILTDAVGISDNGQFITGNALLGTQKFGYVLQIAQITSSRLIVNLRLPNVTLSSIINQTFNTQVDATLNGTNVFTRTFSDAINSTTGTNALNDANAALAGTNGLRRINIGAPVLLSNNTTILSTTNNTIDVLTGTNITKARVITSGPATVATGNLGVCATAAIDNQNPTGCSLTGTIINVENGAINTNEFTNTINSITPTTTPTINQLITAKWQIAATSGNQFGTSHALVGSAVFDQSDGFLNHLHNITSNNNKKMKFFGGAYYDNSSTDADEKNAIANVKSNTNGFRIGGVKSVTNEAQIGVAFDYGKSDVNVKDMLYPENLALNLTQAAVFGGWNNGKWSISGVGNYGFGEVQTRINSPTTQSLSGRNLTNYTLSSQINYEMNLGKSIKSNLVFGARHNGAKLDKFNENGGATPLIGFEKKINRNRVYIGFDANVEKNIGNTNINSKLYGRFGKDSGDVVGVANVVFASNPNGAIMNAFAPNIGKSYSELGASFEAATGANTSIWGGYEIILRDNKKSNSIKLGISAKW